jgi:AraC family transcriptional activator of pobA
MNLVSLPHPNNFLIVESLDYPNPYDFKIPHRHDYFEIILIKQGGGEQLIDFNRTELTSHHIYTIYPRQIHLLQRQNAEGLVLQFRKDIFDFIFPIQHHSLYFPDAAIQLKEADFLHLYQIAEQIQSLNNSKQLSPLSIYKSYSYLQVVLITLIELQQQSSNQHNSFAGKFLPLISQHIKDKRRVADYAEMMNISSDKLTALCKEALGTTPLKLIHEELLLEIKRLMILGKLSLKEIAYELNFENAANFSSFIKTATTFTPTELQDQLNHTLK